MVSVLAVASTLTSSPEADVACAACPGGCSAACPALAASGSATNETSATAAIHPLTLLIGRSSGTALAHTTCHTRTQGNLLEIATHDRMPACTSSLEEVSTYSRSRTPSLRTFYTA